RAARVERPIPGLQRELLPAAGNGEGGRSLTSGESNGMERPAFPKGVRYVSPEQKPVSAWLGGRDRAGLDLGTGRHGVERSAGAEESAGARFGGPGGKGKEVGYCRQSYRHGREAGRSG